MNKKQISYLIIFIAVFIVAIAGATYAYFESNTDLGNASLNTQAKTAGSTSFSGYSTGTIELELTSDIMTQAGVSTSIVASDNASITLSLESENENVDTTCTYDIVWVWDSEDTYTVPDVVLPFTEGENNYPYELSVKVDEKEEKDLSAYTWNNKEAVIETREITSKKGVLQEETYEIKVNAYNIPVIQNNLYNKNFKAHIEIKNTNCTSKEATETVIAAADTIKAQYTSQGMTVGNGVIYLHDDTLENGANDGSYRYAGADPDNYLCFQGDTCDDDHKYRIIGIFGENLKVIKMTSVGKKVWNSSGSNTWDSSTMDTYLNGEWLTSFGHSDLIEDYDWHVGGNNTSAATAKVMHDAEIASTPVVNRKVGLMYVSDYGYAALNNYWTESLYSNTKGAVNTDWLYLKSIEWTISRTSGASNYAFFVYSTGCVRDNLSVSVGYASRPVFYLKSSVEIKSGSGSKVNPWIMGL